MASPTQVMFESRGTAIAEPSIPEYSRRKLVRVFFLYGLYSAYNQMRHGRIQGSVVDVCADIVQLKITHALGRSSTSFRRLYSGMDGSAIAAPRDSNMTCVGEVIFDFRKRHLAATAGLPKKRHRSNMPKRIKQ